jgi:hypothetical protein
MEEAMTAMDNSYTSSSRESEIDAKLDALIAKIMNKTATAKELIEYQELLATRVRLMRPPTHRTSGYRFVVGSAMRRKYA